MKKRCYDRVIRATEELIGTSNNRWRDQAQVPITDTARSSEARMGSKT